MSGDVQVRKRKDKKRKRDSIDPKSEGDVLSLKLSTEEDEDPKEHHGVHATKMGSDDVHLHVQGDHETGGHWCAKIFFFSLLAILLGLIGLIIMENRGLSDLDTPLSESRFSEYFEGWVDEHRDSHDDHNVDKVVAEHDGAFDEEEEEHTELDDDHELESEPDEDHEDEEEEADQQDEGVGEEEASEEEAEANLEEENDADDENDEEEETYASRSKRSLPEDDEDEEEEEEANEDERQNEEDENEEEEADTDKKSDEDDEADEGFGEGNNEEDDEAAEEEETGRDNPQKSSYDNDPFDEATKNTSVTTNLTNVSSANTTASKVSKDLLEDKEIFVKPKEDNFDDDDEEPSVEVIENDDGEMAHLQKKKAQEEPEGGGSSQEGFSSSQVKSRGPQSAYDEDAILEEELRRANEELLQNNFKAALNIYDPLLLKNPNHPGVLRAKAMVLDKLADKHRSNHLLTEAIQLYDKFLNNAVKVDDETFIEVANRCIERMRFIGLHMKAVTIHDKLIKRWPNDPRYPNQLAITFLLLNRLADAKRVLYDILQKWPDDGFAKVHYGFVLKNLDNNLEKAVIYLKEGIESKANGTEDGRFYFNLGDALQRLGRHDEAMEIYEKGADIKLFPSKYQRSLYNVDHLLAKPFWTKKETTYAKYFDIIEQNFEQIKQEGLSTINEKGFFVDEAESLKDVGDWKQFELFARGFRNSKNCQKAPFTCKIIESFPAARNCKRGQVKFSVMHPGTHVWPHCGPTNCRLRAHLGLKVPPDTIIRVAEEKRSWEEGKFLIFDDSFEHEVWHNGTSLRLVLIIDVWHPDLSQQERDQLSRI